MVHRIDSNRLAGWYERIAETFSKAEYKDIQSLLGRDKPTGSLSITMNRPLQLVLENKIFEVFSRNRHIWSDDPESPSFGKLVNENADLFYNFFRKNNPDITLMNQVEKLKGMTIEKAAREYDKIITEDMRKDHHAYNDVVKRDADTGELIAFGAHRKARKRGAKKHWTLDGHRSNRISEKDMIQLSGGIKMMDTKTRAKMVDELLKLSSDAISNDLGDWASARLINEVWARDSISGKRFQELAKLSDKVQRLRQKLDKERDMVASLEDIEMSDGQRKQIEKLSELIELNLHKVSF